MKKRFSRLILYSLSTLVLLGAGGLFAKERLVLAGDEACSGALPVCYPQRRISQWSCADCPVKDYWVCTGDNSVVCGPPQDDSICQPYNGVCIAVCDPSWPSDPDSCQVLDIIVNCNTSFGFCSWSGVINDCVWKEGECIQPRSSATFGCCGTGDSTPPPGTPGPTPTPSPASCSISLPDVSLGVNSSTDIFVTIIDEIGGTIERVDFTSNDTGVATATTPDTSAPFSTTVTGVAEGTTTISATATMDDGTTTCTTTGASQVSDVTITGAGPWWQVQDADVITNGDLVSSIPTATCLPPSCNPVFDLDGSGGYPGVPTYGGSTADFEEGSGTGTVSSTNWLANATSMFRTTYNYAFFNKLRRPDIVLTEITSPTVNGGYFTSGGTQSRGYVWYHFDGSSLGDLTIDSNINLTGDRRVILLVEGADLYIQGRINLNKGQGFFLAIVSKDASGLKGNIYVDPSVSHPSQVELEGIFLAEGQFKTGAGDEQLHIRGSVAAYGGVILERDLADNSTEPAELFEYAPDLIFTYPRDLAYRRYRWKEVAP